MSRQKATVQRKTSAAKTAQPSVWWRPWRIAPLLFVLSIAVYIPSLKLGFTELDDSIFIREFSVYHKNWENLITSFKRGVFHETKDIYYRPLLLNSFLLNYQLAEENIKGWRWVNMILHGCNVLLVYYLLLRINSGLLASAFFAAVFAVHPVLAQAVVWIPGRNDSLLALFVFGYLLLLTAYVRSPNIWNAVGQLLLLSAAFFTKETGVLTPLAAAAFWLLVLRQPWAHRSAVYVAALCFLAFVIWYAVRAQATLEHQQIKATEMVQAFFQRLPTLLYYLSKVFLPVHLSVFPVQRDTPWLPALISALALVTLLWLTMRKGDVDWQRFVGGLFIYVIFIMPALLVPLSFNDQDFEHRLYVPLVGLLVALTALRPDWLHQKPRAVRAAAVLILVVLSAVNVKRHAYFNDPVTFWKKAVADSPSSAYAKMMLASRIEKIEPQRADSLMRLAYRMDSSMKYINYYMGVLLQHRDSVLQSEPYFLRELKKSDLNSCYFHLARVAFEKNDRKQAIEWLQEYLRREPADPQGNHNLMLLYYELGDTVRLRQQVARMLVFGLSVPDAVADAAGY
ncbi:MAG: hypothetical protein NZL95_06955 [Chitinophagales bacterium]|nr:hypothetical protein [Chitinophagales bacterium]MDW8428276.1 hypothetical protein [Chitinophagales bacterium]